MPRYRFIEPELVRLNLSDGDFITVKKRLTAGEQRRVFSRMVSGGTLTPGEKATLDPEQVGLTKIVAYLIGWSFTDKDGKPIEVSESAIDSLDMDTYQEIVKAIDDHEDRMTKEREQEKNGTAAGKTE